MTASPTSAGREVVPDVLRGVAIIAMLIAHAAPAWGSMPGAVRFLTANINDVASPLFALVMGMSAQLLQTRTPAPRRGVLILQQVIRGLVLVGLGVWMATWGSWVAIVLAHLGILIIVGAPIVLLGTRWVVGIAVIVAVLSDPLNALARSHLPTWLPLDNLAVDLLAQTTVLGHSYRLTNLLPFFLLGALLARHGFRRDRVLWTMAAIAPVVYLLRPVFEYFTGITTTVSGSYLDTLHDIGLVFAVYAAVVLVTSLDIPHKVRIVGGLWVLLAALGQLALTLYVLHVGVVALWLRSGWLTYPDDPALWLLTVLGTLAVGWIWWRLIGTGPVEWLLGAVTGRRKALRIRRQRPPSGDTSQITLTDRV